MSKHEISVDRKENGRIECTVTFAEEDVAPAEEKALQKLGGDIKMEGFRPGKVPAELLKDKVDANRLYEETVRELLPDTFEAIAKENDIKPIIPPRVQGIERDPMRVTIVFLERPEVKLKGASKIKVDKKDIKLDEKDVQRMIDYVLQQHQTRTEVNRAVQENDAVVMQFWGDDENGNEIPNTRSEDYQIVVGSKTLIPGFEDNLIGMKKDEQKSFGLTFPDNYQAEELQGKPATFHVTISKIEEVTSPELTDEFAKANLHVESVKEFKERIEESMKMQEMQVERKRREQDLLEQIRKATTVNLEPELVEDELGGIMYELEQELKQHNMGFADWLKQTGQEADQVQTQMKERAEHRLTIRLGTQQLVEDEGIEISYEDMKKIVEEYLSPLSGDERKNAEKQYEPGQEGYEHLKWQKRVEKLIEQYLGKEEG